MWIWRRFWGADVEHRGRARPGDPASGRYAVGGPFSDRRPSHGQARRAFLRGRRVLGGDRPLPRSRLLRDRRQSLAARSARRELARRPASRHGAASRCTGVPADTLLADMLKATDAAAVVDRRLGREIWRELEGSDPFASLRARLGERAYLADILLANASKHALPFARIADVTAAAPPQ
jgi:hypothetical protein